jgi:hypothetical protein
VTAPADYDYAAFLDRKLHANDANGFDPLWLPDFLFDFQRALVTWALRLGRAGIFADCGLGKTPMQLVWAENVVRHTNGRVLVLTPLAVAAQTVREGEKFGINVTRSRDGKNLPAAGIVVTNYERLHYFDPADFVGAVCDESSILKSFDGVIRGQITDFMRKLRFRLLCTATAAPNDYIELGTSSEALGYLGHMDMLARFFKNDSNNCATKRMYATTGSGGPKWRFKGYAEEPFWRWVCSWARAVRSPSDLGFEDRGFVLPPLEQREHVVTPRTRRADMIFDLPVTSLREQREERRRTLEDRCEKVAALVAHDRQALAWCQLNTEGDLLEKLIKGAVRVSGADSDEEKEERFLAFASGDASSRVLVTKPEIGAWGLNFQRCAHVTFFPSHSFEQFYQGVRRCWRFGQAQHVVVDIVTTPGERGVLSNLQRKATAADAMFSRLVALMNKHMKIEQQQAARTREEVPTWL